MRQVSARRALFATAFGAALVLIAPAGGADPADAEFKTMIDQQVVVITDAADAIDKAEPDKKKIVTRNAGVGIKSSAIMMAQLANARITGKDAAADGQAAAIRDKAIEIYKAASDMKYKDAAALAKTFSAPPAPATNAKPIDVAAACGELTPKEVMDGFKTKDKFGSNVEADIKANAKKATIKPADVGLIAHRVLAMSELNKTVKKGENAAEKKTWDDYNAQLMKAAEDLLAASKKKATAADLQKAFTTIDSRCTACHDDDKVGK
jgi:hypothetical protein